MLYLFSKEQGPWFELVFHGSVFVLSQTYFAVILIQSIFSTLFSTFCCFFSHFIVPFLLPAFLFWSTSFGKPFDLGLTVLCQECYLILVVKKCMSD